MGSLHWWQCIYSKGRITYLWFLKITLYTYISVAAAMQMSHPHKQGVCQQLQWCLVSKVEHKYTAGQVFPHHTHTHKHCTCAGYIPIPINGTVLYKTRSITVTCSILNLLLLPITKDRRGEIPGDHCCLYLLVLAKLKYKYNKIK